MLCLRGRNGSPPTRGRDRRGVLGGVRYVAPCYLIEMVSDRRAQVLDGTRVKQPRKRRRTGADRFTLAAQRACEPHVGFILVDGAA